jgi:DNA-binding protein HU-beta
MVLLGSARALASMQMLQKIDENRCGNTLFGCRQAPGSIPLARTTPLAVGECRFASTPALGAVGSPPPTPTKLFCPMNKADLVNLVAARTELTKTDVSQVVDAAIDTIIDSVVEGKKVSILGFGSFEPRERSARQGLNPKTGEKIKIPAKRVPAFTAGKMFKDRVQG